MKFIYSANFYYFSVDSMGLGDIVKVIEFDFTSNDVFAILPALGTVDIITMSYSFTMIPNKQAAIANSVKLLKPNGHLAIADFFLNGNYDETLPALQKFFRSIEVTFHKNWFALDHVFLIGDKELEIINAKELTPVWDNRFRGDTPFLPFLKPYHGVYILKKNGPNNSAPTSEKIKK